MNNAFEAVQRMLAKSCTPERLFPPTELYNEGWMLRLIMDRAVKDGGIPGTPFKLYEKARWFSEAELESAFSPRTQGDKLAEGFTHADAAFGHFDFHKKENPKWPGAKVELRKDPQQFVVVEAKMRSKLAAGVTHSAYYNQAARNVGCMAWLLWERAQKKENLPALQDIGFYVIAPEEQIAKEPSFEEYMAREHIRKTIERRVSEYREEPGPPDSGDRRKKLVRWYDEWVVPLLDDDSNLKIKLLTWEDTLKAASRPELEDFYRSCKDYNSLS